MITQLKIKNIQQKACLVGIFVLITASLFFVAHQAFAVDNSWYNLLEPLAGEIDGVKASPEGLESYLTFLFKFALGVAAVLAVLMLVIAGVERMSPTSGAQEHSKQRIWAALSGLLLALVSYLILQTINPDLAGNLKLTIPEISVTATKNKLPLSEKSGTCGGESGNCHTETSTEPLKFKKSSI